MIFHLNNRGYVIQFDDGSFLERGPFFGFALHERDLRYRKTTDLNQAYLLTFEYQAQRIAYDIKIDEPYKIREVEIIVQLK